MSFIDKARIFEPVKFTELQINANLTYGNKNLLTPISFDEKGGAKK